MRVWHARALAYGEGVAFFIVARGPVPRERWSARAMASLLHRDREVSPTGSIVSGRRDILVPIRTSRRGEINRDQEVSPTGMPYKLRLGRREEGLK